MKWYFINSVVKLTTKKGDEYFGVSLLDESGQIFANYFVPYVQAPPAQCFALLDIEMGQFIKILAIREVKQIKDFEKEHEGHPQETCSRSVC